MKGSLPWDALYCSGVHIMPLCAGTLVAFIVGGRDEGRRFQEDWIPWREAYYSAQPKHKHCRTSTKEWTGRKIMRLPSSLSGVERACLVPQRLSALFCAVAGSVFAHDPLTPRKISIIDLTRMYTYVGVVFEQSLRRSKTEKTSR